jgi:dipeptidyl aminopeptidase/acylaminoacyl peptidase
MNLARLPALAAGLIFSWIAVVGIAQARPVAPEDLLKIAFISNPQISHNGRLVAFVVTRLNGPKNTYLSNIWLADVASGNTWQLTRGDSDDDPQWSPDDATIAFSSGRSEKGQIYRIRVSGGEAERLTNLPNGASSPQWSHDGSRILFSGSEKMATPNSPIDWKQAGFTPTDEQRKSDVRTIDVLHFRANGAGEIFTRHRHTWVMRADGSQPKALTSGNHWSEREAVWSPDDRTIAFSSTRVEDPYQFIQEIYAIPSAGGAMRQVRLPYHSNGQPTWSRSGNRLWYFASTQNDPASYPLLASATPDGADSRVVVPENSVAMYDAVLTDTREGGAGCGPLFEPHDKWFVAIVSVPGGTALRKFDAATGAQKTLVDRGDEIDACSMSDNGTRIAMTAGDSTHPSELFVVDTAGGTPRQLTSLNKSYLASVEVSPAEPFSVKDEAGFTVHAWFMRPPNAVAGRRYPTLLEIHGGPETEFGNSFFHEMQFLAGRGYNVVFSDPRGSVGFGYPFEAALAHNWGDPMFRDTMAIMDAVVKRPDVDGSRLGVLGGSYGGYSTLWIIGHTHRFKAAIAERAVSNMTSQYLAADYASGVSSKYSFGNAWAQQATYWRLSPLAYVANVTTPVLIVHSDQDIRTPIDQSIQEYAALKVLGRTTEFVQFPRDNHDLSRTGEPLHRIERLHILANWFSKFLHP